jgi:hypothetical protein
MKNYVVLFLPLFLFSCTNSNFIIVGKHTNNRYANFECPDDSEIQIFKTKYGIKQYACFDDDNLKQGPYYSEYANGQINLLGHYKDNKKRSKWKTFDKLGLLTGEANYKNDKKHGTEKLWLENEQLFSTEEYYNGVKHGKTVIYNMEGEIVQIRWYKKGVIVKETLIKRESEKTKFTVTITENYYINYPVFNIGYIWQKIKKIINGSKHSEYIRVRMTQN